MAMLSLSCAVSRPTSSSPMMTGASLVSPIVTTSSSETMIPSTKASALRSSAATRSSTTPLSFVSGRSGVSSALVSRMLSRVRPAHRRL